MDALLEIGCRQRSHLSGGFVILFLALLLTGAGSAGWASPCVGGTCLPNGYISYHGKTVMAGSSIVSYNLADLETASKWNPGLRTMVDGDFAVIQQLNARGVRILIHPLIPAWNVGVPFPAPSSHDLQPVTDMIDLAAKHHLTVFFEILVPDEYKYKSPAALDNFYARNNKTLLSNLFVYWDHVIPAIYASRGPDGLPRGNHIDSIGIFGDFDPLGTLVLPKNGVIPGGAPLSTLGPDNLSDWSNPSGDPRLGCEWCMYFQRDWMWSLWPNFRSWYSYIPVDKKIFELVGDPAGPALAVSAQITWVRDQLLQKRIPLPTKFSFEAYANLAWLKSYPSPYAAYVDLFQKASAAAGGSSHIIVEEVGVDTCTYAQWGPSSLNDGQGGALMYSASFAALRAVNPSIAIGIWSFSDSVTQMGPNGECLTNDAGNFGLLDRFGQWKQGAWVIPYYFSN